MGSADGALLAERRSPQPQRARLPVAGRRALGTPFRHDARLALAHGATAAELTALVTFTSEFGFSKAWTASAALAEVFKAEVH